MPIDHDDNAFQRIDGLPAKLQAHQEEAVARTDMRLLPWESDCGADEFAAAKKQLQAQAAANPRPSTLLDKLKAGEPVVVETTLVRTMVPPATPSWLRDPQECWFVRVYADGLVEPVAGSAEDALADQLAS